MDSAEWQVLLLVADTRLDLKLADTYMKPLFLTALDWVSFINYTSLIWSRLSQKDSLRHSFRFVEIYSPLFFLSSKTKLRSIGWTTPQIRMISPCKCACCSSDLSLLTWIQSLIFSWPPGVITVFLTWSHLQVWTDCDQLFAAVVLLQVWTVGVQSWTDSIFFECESTHFFILSTAPSFPVLDSVVSAAVEPFKDVISLFPYFLCCSSFSYCFLSTSLFCTVWYTASKNWFLQSETCESCDRQEPTEMLFLQQLVVFVWRSHESVWGGSLSDQNQSVWTRWRPDQQSEVSGCPLTSSCLKAVKPRHFHEVCLRTNS